MPSVSYDRQSFSIDGRRLWLLAASISYTRVPVSAWRDRLADIRQAGFNTVEVPCPWMIHEPRKGKFDFEGPADVRAFLETCRSAGLGVILRIGPYVGAAFDGGGLPAWLTEENGVRLREGDPAFLDPAARFFRKLVGEVGDLQATKDGPIRIVQIEHEWMCANEAEGAKYLGELTRIARETGFAVPFINTNNLWLEAPGTIDCWRGESSLLANLRQLRAIQPNAPRLVSVVEAEARATWGDRPKRDGRADERLRRVAEVLAAGAQPVLSPFHGGTNFGFTGGRRAGSGNGYTTTAAVAPPLGEAGARGEAYHRLRRLVTFADQFGAVFADLDPDHHPVALDPDESASGAAVISLRGGSGRVIFVFTDGRLADTTLLLDHGVRLPIDVREQRVGWFVMDVDLRGQGRLDYANVCPFAIVGDRIIFHGPAKGDVHLSVNGAAVTSTVPAGGKPKLLEHKGVKAVIVNHALVDRTYFDEDTIYVGVDGLDADGAPRPAPGTGKAWSIGPDGVVRSFSPASVTSGGRKRAAVRPGSWSVAEATDYADGSSPRYASLPGPQSLAACGAPVGYGWYRVELKLPRTGKRRLHAPRARHRMHLFLDGEPAAVVGPGPGAHPLPHEMSLPKGKLVMTALVDNQGRLAEGNDLERAVGFSGALVAVAPLKGVRAKTMDMTPVDPFTVRGFIAGAATGRLSEESQVVWAFTHAKKSAVIVSATGSARGTFVLNDTPIAYYAGDTGGKDTHLHLEPAEVEAFKRGKNVLRFAPDAGQTGANRDAAQHVKLYEAVEMLSEGAAWSFAKWEPPAATKFKAASATEVSRRRTLPTWWRTRIEIPARPEPLWFDTKGLSKGHLLVNGQSVGRYFTATSTGKAVGPQTRLFVPPDVVSSGAATELVVFDEHGFSPAKTSLVFDPRGDLDEA